MFSISEDIQKKRPKCAAALLTCIDLILSLFHDKFGSDKTKQTMCVFFFVTKVVLFLC